MKAAIVFLALTVILGACGSSDTPGANSNERVDPASAEVMAAAVGQLIRNEYTFGGELRPNRKYQIQRTLDPDAGRGPKPDIENRRDLTDYERSAIENVLSPHGPVSYIDDPDEWIEAGSGQNLLEGAMILTVGEPTILSTSALVPMTLSCGDLCWLSLTYKVELIDGTWVVTGTEGEVGHV